MAIKLNRYLVQHELSDSQQKFLDRHKDGYAVMTYTNQPSVLYIDPELFTTNEQVLIDILFSSV